MHLKLCATRILLIPAFLTVLSAQPSNRPFPGERDGTRQERALFERTRADLDRAGHYPYASRADRKRFDEARRELFDFESRFDQGRYDRHELDQAIDRLQKVESHNSLDPRDRGALADDIRRMRDYRAFRVHSGRLYPGRLYSER